MNDPRGKSQKSRGGALIPQSKSVPAYKNDPTDPLDGIELSGTQIRRTLGGAGMKALAKSVPVVGKFFELLEDADQEVREEKLRILLNQFQDRFASTEAAIKQLRSLFVQRAGLILIQKVIHIVDAGDADDEWIGLLANALKVISETDLTRQFQELSYLLSQISRLSPQGLIILSKHEFWKRLSLSGTTTSSGQTVSGDWDGQAAKHFSGAVGIGDASAVARVAHAFRD